MVSKAMTALSKIPEACPHPLASLPMRAAHALVALFVLAPARSAAAGSVRFGDTPFRTRRHFAD
jgi:hypothetical protein